MTDIVGGHSTATLYEASKLDCACDPGLRAAWPDARVAGPAFTVRGVGGDNLALHHAVLAAPAGSVLVADMQGAAHGHWGEILAVAAQSRGITGLVIDGGVRDVDELARIGFPVFARTTTVVGTVKDYAGDFESPVRIGGIVVRAGDVIVGDADGVVVLPAEAAAEVVAKADQRVSDEQRIIEALRAGETTVDLYDLRPAATMRSSAGMRAEPKADVAAARPSAAGPSGPRAGPRRGLSLRMSSRGAVDVRTDTSVAPEHDILSRVGPRPAPVRGRRTSGVRRRATRTCRGSTSGSCRSVGNWTSPGFRAAERRGVPPCPCSPSRPPRAPSPRTR